MNPTCPTCGCLYEWSRAIMIKVCESCEEKLAHASK